MNSLRIADIHVSPERKRSATAANVGELAESISVLGPLNPIIVNREHLLIAGLHRLRAAQSLGWEEIPAVVVELDGLDAELVEIDENLCRAELSELARSVQTLRRQIIYEEQHPETKQFISAGLASMRKQGRFERATFESLVPFTDDTAEKTGAHERTIERRVQVAKGVSPEVQTLLADTAVAHHQGNLVALARIADPEIQLAVATLLVQGEAKSVSTALGALQPGDEAEVAEPGVVRDQVGQELTDPEIAQAFYFVTERVDAAVSLLHQANRAWGNHTHEELVRDRGLRVVESKTYMFTRNLIERELKKLAALIRIGKPFALCPYCQGKPLAADRQQYCQGCGGGGWVAESTYGSAPPEAQVPGIGRGAERRGVEATSEVARE